MKLIRFVCAVIFAIFIAGCTEKETQVEVSSVSLNTATIEMVEGETFSLVATVLPKDAEYDKVIWASSNASVARVNSGTVTAIKEGITTITASAGGKSATCSVKVSTRVVAVTSITLDKTSLSMQVGETKTITATVNPDNATDKTVTWGSSDVSVATVSDGKVTAKKSGTAIITAKSGSCIAECTVTISVDVESVTLDKTSLSLAVGETATLTATVKPDDATDKNVSWTSSDESVAKVDNGNVSAIEAGKATITAKCGGKTAECAVTVTVPVSSIILDKATLSLAVGETATLIATVKPDDATDKNIIWTSSDESIAKVESGKVIALGVGNVMITASIGMVSSICNVTVIRSNNIIIYTSTDGSIVKPYNEDAFGAKILSNENIDGLGLIKFDSPVTSVGRGAFYACNSLSTIILPETVTMIGLEAFMLCNRLSQVNIPSNVTTIEDRAFRECGVKHMVLPRSLSSLGKEVFVLSSLETINIPEGLSEIKSNTFAFSRLKTIEIPHNVRKIGERAFNQADLNNVVLHEGVESIGDLAFYGTAVRNIIFPRSLVELGHSAFYGTNLENVTIPGNISTIRVNTFKNCEKLMYVIMSEGVKRIEDGSFDNCYLLESISLPGSILFISNAFRQCRSITKVYIKAQNPPNQIALYTLKNFYIYVPKASVDLYKEKWSDYKDNIQGYDF